MNFTQFKNNLKNFPVFSLNDIRGIYPKFYYDRITDWQKKDYIIRIIKNHYIFSDTRLDKQTMFFIANRIYEPSYVSLEMAFSFYKLIPEGVFTFTSVSSRKPTVLRSKIGTFAYRHLKPGLIFGYKVIRDNNFPVKMAEIEKAILDYLYLNPHVKTEDDFFEMRFDEEEVKSLLDLKLFKSYLAAFGSKALEKRAKAFLTFIYDKS